MSLAGPVLSIQLPVASHSSITLHSPIVSPTSSPALVLTDMQSISSAQTNPANVSIDSASEDAFPNPPIKQERANSAGNVTAIESVTVTDSPSLPATSRVSHSLNLPTGSLSPLTIRSRSLPRGDMTESESTSLSPQLNVANRSRIGTSPRFIRRAKTIESSSYLREEFEEYTQVNQYKVLNIIGHGAFGIVRKATSIEDDVTYAMKIVGKKRLKRRGALGRPKPGVARIVKNPLDDVKKEIVILKKLDHPNIVRLFEVLDDPNEDDLILVFEFIPNGTVIEKLPMEKPFTEADSRNYFVDVILGLEYLHSQHVIHRDIKPMNLLLDNEFRIKIADFGVSEEIERSETNLSRWAGTPAFVAPECLDTVKNSFQGQAVDIWAVGVTLYCFVLGKVPWSPPVIIDLYEEIKSKDAYLPDSLDSDLADLLTRLLEKDPAKRITIPEIRRHPWILQSIRPIPTTEENCLNEISISEDDMMKAFKPFRTPIHILAMIKQMAKKRSFNHPFTPKSSPANSPSSSPLTSPVMSPRHTIDSKSEHKISLKREKFAHTHPTTVDIVVNDVED